MLLRVCRADRPGWHFRLMMHEFAQPTPAMASVIDETMRPVYDRFRELIGSMLDLPPDHDQVRLSTHSVIAQVVHYAHARHVVSRVWPELELNPERIEQIAAHIADFSLAGLRQCAAAAPSAPAEGNDEEMTEETTEETRKANHREASTEQSPPREIAVSASAPEGASADRGRAGRRRLLHLERLFREPAEFRTASSR